MTRYADPPTSVPPAQDPDPAYDAALVLGQLQRAVTRTLRGVPLLGSLGTDAAASLARTLYQDWLNQVLNHGAEHPDRPVYASTLLISAAKSVKTVLMFDLLSAEARDGLARLMTTELRHLVEDGPEAITPSTEERALALEADLRDAQARVRLLERSVLSLVGSTSSQWLDEQTLRFQALVLAARNGHPADSTGMAHAAEAQELAEAYLVVTELRRRQGPA